MWHDPEQAAYVKANNTFDQLNLAAWGNPKETAYVAANNTFNELKLKSESIGGSGMG